MWLLKCMWTYECVVSFGKPNFRQDAARWFLCTVCLFWHGLPWYACVWRHVCKLCSNFVSRAVGSATARRFASLCSLCAVGSATARSLPSSRSFEERWDCFVCCFTCLLTSCVMKSASFDVHCCKFYVKNCRHVGFFGQLPCRNSRTTKLCPLHLICLVALWEKHLEFEFEVFAYFTRQFLCVRHEQIKHVRCCVRRCADVWWILALSSTEYKPKLFLISFVWHPAMCFLSESKRVRIQVCSCKFFHMQPFLLSFSFS